MMNSRRTKKAFNLVFYSLILLLCIAPCCMAVNVSDPTEQLQLFIDDVIDILADTTPANSGKEARLDKIMDIANDGFDFREMSKRVLGKQWRALSEEEKEKFVEVFTQLLKYVYIFRMDSYSDQQIKFVKQRVKGNRAQVNTYVIDGEKKIPVSYIMICKNEKWLIYDVAIEGVCLVRNYQQQFHEILRENNFDFLTQQLEKKIDNLRNEKS